MVYGTSFCPINRADLLVELNCADSKELNEQTRDVIFSEICRKSNVIGWAVEVISPNVICNNMLNRQKCSLNEVSMNSAIGLIRACIENGVNIAQIYVDTVGPPEKYQSYLLSIFPQYKITVAKKADSTYPIVSAASICAKVTRDHALQVWKFQEGIEATFKDFGSGYPGDPVTKKFLVDYVDPVFGYPQLVRFSWSTARNALENTAYHVEYEEEDENQPPANTTQITSFFKMTKSKSIKHTRHKYFTERFLSSTTEF